MSKNQRYYPPEFKREALTMLATGNYTLTQLERELGITPGLVRQWKRRAEHNGEYIAPNSEPTTPKAAAARIRELEKENARLRQEREILKKAKRAVHRRHPSAAETNEIRVYRNASGRI